MWKATYAGWHVGVGNTRTARSSRRRHPGAPHRSGLDTSRALRACWCSAGGHLAHRERAIGRPAVDPAAAPGGTRRRRSTSPEPCQRSACQRDPEAVQEVDTTEFGRSDQPLREMNLCDATATALPPAPSPPAPVLFARRFALLGPRGTYLCLSRLRNMPVCATP